MRRTIQIFLIVGGLLVPLVFTCSWLLLELIVSDPDTKNDWLVNIQQAQVMLWPSSLIQMAAPQQAFNVFYFAIAVGINLILYGVLGFAFAWLSKSVAGLVVYWALCSALLMVLALFWGQNVLAGVFGAGLVGGVLLIFRKYRRGTDTNA